eukprot:8044915-Alexandrium_andersonii.AAC.1
MINASSISVSAKASGRRACSKTRRPGDLAWPPGQRHVTATRLAVCRRRARPEETGKPTPLYR